jgi:hypothetical protein
MTMAWQVGALVLWWSALCAAAADKPKQKSPWGPLFVPPSSLETIDFRFELVAFPHLPFPALSFSTF